MTPDCLSRPASTAGLTRALACTALALLVGCGPKAPTAAGPAPGPLTARVIEAKSTAVPLTVTAVGQVEGSKEVEVRSRVSGTLRKVLFKEGEPVREGAPLFQLDPEPFEIALAQARAQHAQESARNEQARREAARLRDLAGQRAVSQREADDAASALKLSDAALQAAEARLREAQLNLSYTQVNAPVAGMTGRAERSVGSLITASGADSLLTTLRQIDPVWVRFSLSDSDLTRLPGGRLPKGTASDVRLLLPDGSVHPSPGRLNFTAAQIDPRLATLALRAEFGNAGGALLPGQFVRVRLTAGQRAGVFLVPQAAVTQTEAGYLLFVLDGEGKAQARPGKVGDWVGKDWVILDGLKAGDRVVVDNLMKLRPGTPVTPAAGS